MKKRELKNLLYKKGVSENLYNLDETGRKDERFCLEKRDNKWYVYFSERGIKTTEEEFDSEEAACRFIYEQLVN